MVGGHWWVVVQKETHIQRVVVEVVDLTIGVDIDGVFVDMHAINAIRDATKIDEGEKCWQ